MGSRPFGKVFCAAFFSFFWFFFCCCPLFLVGGVVTWFWSSPRRVPPSLSLTIGTSPLALQTLSVCPLLPPNPEGKFLSSRAIPPRSLEQHERSVLGERRWGAQWVTTACWGIVSLKSSPCCSHSVVLPGHIHSKGVREEVGVDSWKPHNSFLMREDRLDLPNLPVPLVGASM